MISAMNLINGKGAAFTSYDPVKDEEINQYNGASTAQIHAAVYVYQTFKILDFDARAE